MSIAKKLTRAEELRAQRDRLTEEIAAAEREEREAKELLREPAPGAKILIEARFPGGSQVYEYLAMRTENTRTAGDNWYVTGQKGKTSWSRIIELVGNARTVEIFDLDFER